MGYTLSYDSGRNLILGKVEGLLSVDLVNDMSAELARLAERHQCFRLLNDLRKARITQSVMDIYSMPRSVRSEKVPMRIMRALVVREINDDFRFLETVSANTGQVVKLFTDTEMALKWLEIE